MTARRLLFFAMCTVVLLMQAAIVYAQPGDPGDPDAVPITGLEYLIGGGILYGIRSLLKARKKQSD